MHELKMVITGAVYPGVGRAIVERMAENESISIALLGKTKNESTDSFLQQCRTQYQADVRYIECDITNRESVATSLDRAAQSLGGLNLAVHAAHAMLPISATSPDAAQKLNLSMSVNYHAFFLLAKNLFPFFSKCQDARLVNISPPIGSEASAYRGNIAYVSTQFARSMLTTAFANDPEWQKHNIMVNSLWPLKPSQDCNMRIYQSHLEKSQRSESLSILAKAAHKLLTQERGRFTPNGECIFDEEFLELNEEISYSSSWQETDSMQRKTIAQRPRRQHPSRNEMHSYYEPNHNCNRQYNTCDEDAFA